MTIRRLAKGGKAVARGYPDFPFTTGTTTGGTPSPAPSPTSPTGDPAAGRDALVSGTYSVTRDNTGVPAGTQLQDYNDPSTNVITLPDANTPRLANGDAVLENVRIYGDIRADPSFPYNVHVNRVEAVGGSHNPTFDTAVFDLSYGGPRVGTGRWFLTDVIVKPRYPANGRNGIKGYRFVARRCYIRDVVDGISIFTTSAQGPNADVEVYDPLIEDLVYFAPDTLVGRADTHGDLFVIQGGKRIRLLGGRLRGTVRSLAGTPDAIAAAGFCDQGILVQNNTGTGIDRTVILERYEVSHCLQQVLIKATVPEVTIRDAVHHRVVYQGPESSGYWQRIERRSATNVIGLGTARWADGPAGGPYAGQLLTEPRDRGIHFDA